MTIYATGNPVGSTNPKDLIDNSQNLDWLILGPLLSYPDRLGVNRLSWAGIEASFAAAQAARAGEYSADKLNRDTEFAEDQAERIAEFDADQNNRIVQFNTFMDASGYEPPIAYAAGILLDRTTKTVSYLGNEYRAKGSFIPFTTSNWATDEAKLKLIGDDSLRQQLADPTDPSKGIGMVAANTPNYAKGPAYLKILSDVINGYPVNDSMFLDKTKIPLIRAGSNSYDAYSDLVDMFNSGANEFHVGGGVFNYSGELITPDGSTLRGSGSGTYQMVGSNNVNVGGVTCFQPMHSGAGTKGMTLGQHAIAENFMIRAANFAVVDVFLVEYPDGAGNADVGIYCGTGALPSNITMIGFKETNMDIGQVVTANKCHSFQSKLGFRSYATDSELLNCVGMFCMDAGAKLTHNYLKTIGGRFEWNARYGLITGAEAVCVGATFDRNGLAGLKRESALWGGTVTGNYFSRNGVGGNGTKGRWNFSVPGHPSYLDVPHNMSAHIEINNEHALTLTGNRYRHGLDDAGGGADGPAYIYTSTGAVGGTTVNGLTLSGNEGEVGSSVLGYHIAYPSSTGFQAGGTDTGMATFLNTGLQRNRVGTVSPLNRAMNTTLSAVSTLDIKVPRASASGRVLVRFGDGVSNGRLADVYFCTDAIGTRPTATIAPLVGTGITAAVLTPGVAPDIYSTLTLTFSASFFVAYKIEAVGG